MTTIKDKRLAAQKTVLKAPKTIKSAFSALCDMICVTDQEMARALIKKGLLGNTDEVKECLEASKGECDGLFKQYCPELGVASFQKKMSEAGYVVLEASNVAAARLRRRSSRKTSESTQLQKTCCLP
jgi:hypothetical protein